jgi:hypothetical protein
MSTLRSQSSIRPTPGGSSRRCLWIPRDPTGNSGNVWDLGPLVVLKSFVETRDFGNEANLTFVPLCRTSSMRFMSKHSPAIGRLFLLLFFLANSGLTVVLYHCTMGDLDCCRKSDEEMSCACNTMNLPQSPCGPAVTSGDACQPKIVAGGLKTDPAVVEKESPARVIKVDLVPAFTPNSQLSTASLPVQSSSLAAIQNILPPAVETYVLNSTLLI